MEINNLKKIYLYSNEIKLRGRLSVIIILKKIISQPVILNRDLRLELIFF